jgi:hypothetical protein
VTPGTRVQINEKSPFWRTYTKGTVIGPSQPGAVRVLLDEPSPLGGTLTVSIGLHELDEVSS